MPNMPELQPPLTPAQRRRRRRRELKDKVVGSAITGGSLGVSAVIASATAGVAFMNDHPVSTALASMASILSGAGSALWWKDVGTATSELDSLEEGPMGRPAQATYPSRKCMGYG